MPKQHGTIKKTFDMAGMFARVWSDRHFGLGACRPVFINLYVTGRCNSKCRTCNMWKDNTEKSNELSTQELLALAPAARDIGIKLISISGGEPTLRNDLETCIAGFRDAGLSVHMNTNGLLVDEARAKSLADSGLSIVYISCDAADRESYKQIRGVDGFEKAEAAVKHFRSLPSPIPVGINVTVSRLNIDKLEETVDHFMQWDVQKVQFILVHQSHGLHEAGIDDKEFEQLRPRDINQLKETLPHLATKLRGNNIMTNSNLFISRLDTAYTTNRIAPCLAGYLFFNIDSNGEVFPCFKHRTSLSIRDLPLEKIVTTKEFLSAREAVKNCSEICYDTGSAESSIRFHLPYLAGHPIESCRQALSHF